MFYTYILISEKTGKLYIGQTNNLDDRLYRHNAGQNKATKAGVPWKLISSVKFNSRQEAVLLERKLKSWKNPGKVLEWETNLSRNNKLPIPDRLSNKKLNIGQS